MGRVYLARQTMLRDRRVAIKEVAFDLLPEAQRTEALSAFREEAATLAGLSHPNLVDVKDFFEEDARVYLVMDYVQGETLEDRVARQGPLSESQCLDFGGQLCTVLSYLHEAGIVFRDLKPANIMVDARGTLRLIDFGLAHVASGAEHPAAGTSGYASIEQMMGDRPHPTADVYGLGATLFHLLTGQVPPDAFSRLLDDALSFPETVPAWLAEAVQRMMAMKPEERCQTAALARALLERTGGDAPSFSSVDTCLRDLLGRRYDVEIISATNDRLRFTCALPRLVVQPRELYFDLGQDEPVRVPFHIVESKVDKDTTFFDVRLLEAPLSVYRALRDSYHLGVRKAGRTSFEPPLPALLAALGMAARVLDVSRTGLRLLTDQPLPFGRHLPISVSREGKTLEGTAQVCWSRVRSSGGYECGLRFTDPSGGLQALLDAGRADVQMTA